MVKCGDQISAEVSGNCLLELQTRGHIHRNFLKKFSGARTVAQLPLHMTVSPRPKAIRGIENARINSPTPLVLGPNPEGRYRGGALLPCLVLRLLHRSVPVSSVRALLFRAKMWTQGRSSGIYARVLLLPLYWNKYWGTRKV